MGSCEHKDVLLNEARRAAAALNATGVKAVVAETSLSQYSVKLALEAGGHVVVSYSPKKGSFKYHTETVPSKTAEEVARCLSQPASDKTPSVAASSARSGGDVTEVYVDGSYANGQTGYGVVVLKNGQMVWEHKGIVSSDIAGESRQVAGELQAVLDALEWCSGNAVDRTTIYYDYSGIEQWATGEWKAKQPLTQAYRARMQETKISITWQKVAAHTGNRWNEYVDKLARDAAQSAKPAEPAQPPVQLDHLAASFIDFLKKQGIDAEVKRQQSVPYQHVQIKVACQGEAYGHFNIYQTGATPPHPKFHELKTEESRALFRTLWGQFTSPAPNNMEEIEYYYRILKPYRNLRFDFGPLAEAIDRAWRSRVGEGFDANASRFDFESLERAREQLLVRSTPSVRD